MMKARQPLNHAGAVLLAMLTSVPIAAADETGALKPDQFLRTWKTLGPISAFEEGAPKTVDGAKASSFDADLLAEAGGEAAADANAGNEVLIRGKSLTWTSFTSDSNEIDLREAVGNHTWSIAYAETTFHVTEATQCALGIGSDDAVRVWLNGQLVHDNWTTRPLRKDADLVPVSLIKGENRLLLKVLNRASDWGFACRVLSEQALAKRFVSAGFSGDLDALKRLRGLGVEVDAANAQDLTAYQGAKVRGHTVAANWLAEQGADASRPFADPNVYVEAMLSDLVKPEEPGVAVLVSRGGRIVFSNGYGLANTADNIPVTPETKFRIGSVTKQFTAAAILKLQEEGQLSVTDKLTKFIPDYPRGDEVTLHHLLTHTSGITSYTSKPDFFAKVTAPIEALDLIASFKQDKFAFDPGEKWSYCNSGYFLLGYIIEQVSGKSYGEYLTDTFFEPLAMHNTGVHRADLELDHEAGGYSYSNGKFATALNWDMSHAGGAGALYSTVVDLQRWNEGIFGGPILKPATLEAAFTRAQTKTDDNPLGYGYGWMVAAQRGLKTIGHGGGLQGFSSYLTRFPDQQLTIAVLHNALPTSGAIEPTSIATRVAEIYLWQQMRPQQQHDVDSSVDPTTYLALKGRYDYGSGVIMTVTTEGDRLFAQLTGQPKYEIFPAKPSRFFWKVVEAEAEFLRDDQGNVIAVQHSQGGRSFKAPKLPDEIEVNVVAELLDSYTGTYDFGQVGKLVVTRNGDHLLAKLGTQPAVDVYPKSETVFFYKIVKAEIEFIKNGEGKVEKANLRQGPVILDGKRID